MKPVHQVTDSDCMRASVASIFELPLERVPFFGESAIRDIPDRNAMTDEQRSRAALQQADDFAAWLSRHGLEVRYISDPEWAKERGANLTVKDLPWGLCIGDGKSPRGDWDHSTVWDATSWTERKMVHDPHPSGAGLAGRPHTFSCFLLVDPAKFRTLYEGAIEAGDSAKHGPSGETWYVLGVDSKRGKACIAGWPPTICELADLTLVEKGRGINEEEAKYRSEAFGQGWD